MEDMERTTVKVKTKRIGKRLASEAGHRPPIVRSHTPSIGWSAPVANHVMTPPRSPVRPHGWLCFAAICLALASVGVTFERQEQTAQASGGSSRHLPVPLARQVAARLAITELDGLRLFQDRAGPTLRQLRSTYFVFPAPWIPLPERDVLASLPRRIVLDARLKRELRQEPGFAELINELQPKPPAPRRRVLTLEERVAAWLQAPPADRHIEVAIGSQQLYLNAGNQRFAELPVSTGINISTPRGRFRVTEKVKFPPYYLHGQYAKPGSPDNPLGHAWIGLNARHWYTGSPIGIHGTNEPNLIGSPVSRGCVRLKNAEALLLCQSVPVGCQVWIHD